MKGTAFAALLLAGGASRRMGSPKAMLDFHGRPLWKWQMDKLQVLAFSEFFVSVPRDLSLPSGAYRILHDASPGLGPLAGICEAGRAMSADWLLVLAIDLPAMTATFLQLLCDDAVAGQIGQVPVLDGYHMGLAAVYPRAYLDRTAENLRSEDRSMQRFAREGVAGGFLFPRPVLESEHGLFRNMNEPREYADAVAQINAPLRYGDRAAGI